MIIFEDKNIHQNSLHPDTDWTEKAKWVISDSNTELCRKAFEYCPNFEVVVDENNNVIDIVKTETPIEQIRARKISEFSVECEQVITQGFDLNEQHYSLTLNDQANLNRLYLYSQQNLSPIMYHADGENIREYTQEEFAELYETANTFINYHTSYFNLLKKTINKMSILSEIEKCYYGMELDETDTACLTSLTNA